MENETPKTPRNRDYNVHNTAGDIDPDASVIQAGHLHDQEDGRRGSVRNSVGNVAGGASVIQAGDIHGDINL